MSVHFNYEIVKGGAMSTGKNNSPASGVHAALLWCTSNFLPFDVYGKFHVEWYQSRPIRVSYTVRCLVGTVAFILAGTLLLHIFSQHPIFSRLFDVLILVPSFGLGFTIAAWAGIFDD